MWNQLRRVALLLGLFFCLLLAFTQQANAQNNISVSITPPNTDNFPRITTYLSLHSVESAAVSGLTTQSFLILEGNHQLAAGEATQINAGIQLVTAIAPGPSFAIRDSMGNSRYFYLVESLRAWTEAHLASQGESFSLIAPGVAEHLSLSSAEAWFAELENYQPESRIATPTLDTLFRAVEVVGDLTTQPEVGRAVLWITAPQDTSMGIALRDLASRANQKGIHIFVWMIATPELRGLPEELQLQDLASQTGGQLFFFSGVEELPNLDTIIQPLRTVYTLSFDSQINASGTYTLAVAVKAPGLQVTSLPQQFDVTILPPNPIFVSLPSQVQPAEKTTTSLSPKPNQDPTLLTGQALEVMIEFPDGHPRPLVSSVLYIDGVAVAQNTAPPFEKFTWDFNCYSESGKHLLRVEVTDSLGLSGSSLETPIQVNISKSDRGILSWVPRQGFLLAGLGVFLAGVVLALVLIWGGRLRPRVYAHGTGRLTRPASAQVGRSRRRVESHQPPVPASIEATARRLHNRFSRPSWAHRYPMPKASAFLTFLSDTEETPPPAPIPLTGNEVTIGRDPIRATLVLDDPTVETLHARLLQEGGAYRLADEGSIAGTWVNYTQIPQEGVCLEHGDLIHIGRLGFRFSMRHPTHIRKPVVVPQETYL